MIKLDELDKKIIKMLMENARVPFLEIARECGISGAAVHQRVQKLEDNKVLIGSTFILNEKVLGYDTCAFIGVYLESANKYNTVVESLKRIPEVVACHYMTGNYAIFLKVYAQNNRHLMDILNHQIQSIHGISSTETFISLDQPIERSVKA